MNLLQKHAKYREYLKKLEHAREINDQSASINHLTKKTDLLLEELRKKDDILEHQTIIWMLAIPVILIVVISNAQFGNYFRLAPIPLLFVYLAVYRTKLIGMTRLAAKAKANRKQSVRDKNHHYLYLKIDYLINGLKIKLARIKGLQWYYCLFFPVLILFATELIKGSWPFGNFLISMVISLLVGGVGWIYLFKSEINELSILRDQLQGDLHSLC